MSLKQGTMNIKQWIRKRKMNEFIVTFGIVVLSFWLVNLLWYRLFGGPRIHWFEAILWGLAVSALGTYDGRPWRRDSTENS